MEMSWKVAGKGWQNVLILVVVEHERACSRRSNQFGVVISYVLEPAVLGNNFYLSTTLSLSLS